MSNDICLLCINYESSDSRENFDYLKSLTIDKIDQRLNNLEDKIKKLKSDPEHNFEKSGGKNKKKRTSKKVGSKKVGSKKVGSKKVLKI